MRFPRIFLRILYLVLITAGIFYGGHHIAFYMISKTFAVDYDRNVGAFLEKNREQLQKNGSYLWNIGNSFFERNWWGCTIALTPDSVSLPITFFFHVNFFQWFLFRTVKVTARITPHPSSVYNSIIGSLLLQYPQPFPRSDDPIKLTLSFEGKEVFIQDADIHFPTVRLSYKEAPRNSALPNTCTINANTSISHLISSLGLLANLLPQNIYMLLGAVNQDSEALEDQSITLKSTVSFHGRVSPVQSPSLHTLNGDGSISVCGVPLVEMFIKTEKPLSPEENIISVGINLITLKNAYKKLYAFSCGGLGDDEAHRHNSVIIRHIPMDVQKEFSEKLKTYGAMYEKYIEPHISSKNPFYTVRIIFQGDVLDALTYAFQKELLHKSSGELSHISSSFVRMEYPPEKNAHKQKNDTTKKVMKAVPPVTKG